MSNGKLVINHLQYAASIVQTYLEKDDPPTLIFMEPSAVSHLAKTKKILFYDPIIYTQAIGKLLYLCYSWPNIVFAVHKLCQFAYCPYKIYWVALGQILQYIKGIITFRICWNRPNWVFNENNCKHGIEGHAGSLKKDDVLGFLNSNHASNLTNRKSCWRAVFLIWEEAIAYKSKKQLLIKCKRV